MLGKLTTAKPKVYYLHFYQQVKLVNFIRRQIHQSRCYGCEQRFENRQAVLQHLSTEGHVMKLPQMSIWNQPQYYFPTYENDALLCTLSDSDDDDDEDADGVPVIAEDISNLRALKQTSVLNQLLRTEAPAAEHI
ncbi:hypothetical protein WMY93_023214 [Mugilogobius chulae]|uniref:C2H2-type domain-containing protein n=1 Tax=Mugilogobius chulae TaxID=88201 RepID=A0AAW0N4R7_9GOBI